MLSSEGLSRSVALLVRGAMQSSGGVIVQNLKKHLINFGFTAEAITVKKEKRAKNLLPQEGARLITYSHNFLKHFFLSHRIGRYTLYHSESYDLFALMKRLRPFVITVHDLAFLRTKNIHDEERTEYLYHEYLRAKEADAVICVSDNTKKDVLELLGVKPEKVFVIAVGVDNELFRVREKSEARAELNLPQSKRIILNIGSERPNKNIKTLLEIFAIVKKELPDVLLLRIGPKEETTDELIEEMEIGDSVIRTGIIAGSPHLYYNAADVYLCTDIYAGFGMPNLEAMASGCPVVTSNGGAIPEVVADAAVMFDPFDSKTAADAVVKILNDAKTAQLLAIRGLERAKKFDWHKIAEQTASVYKLVLGKE